MESMQEALQTAGVVDESDKSSIARGSGNKVNVGEYERYASAIGGGALALYGLTQGITRGSWGGFALALIGGSLIYRGTTGHCNVYEAAGINTAGTAGVENPVDFTRVLRE